MSQKKITVVRGALPALLGLVAAGAIKAEQGIGKSVASADVRSAATDRLPVVPGALRRDATIHSIGVEWDLAGDANHNATCRVQFRRRGEAEWTAALPLFRVDYAWHYGDRQADRPANMMAGSILFLQPGTEYEVRLELQDPDGGGGVEQFDVATRRIPQMPAGGRRWHVVPGSGGGSGTEKDPFRGIAAADAAACPGDIMLLHAGRYGEVEFKAAGAADTGHVVWTAAGDGPPIVDAARISGNYIWIDGLTFRRASRNRGIDCRPTAVEGAVITRNRLSGYHYCIAMNAQCRNWHVADNILVGSKSYPHRVDPARPAARDGENDPIAGEGVEMAESRGGHAVCYNTISRVADGISYPGPNCDIFGNDIFECTDDALELDRGEANVRAWGNRIANIGNYAISFQPMNCGPWYILRNQIISTTYLDTELRGGHVFKFRVQDRFAFLNNTVVFGRGLGMYADSMMDAMCRNNLFISSSGQKPIWFGGRARSKDGTPQVSPYAMPLHRPNWRTDVDYNGYDWGDDPGRKESVFAYFLEEFEQPGFRDLASWSAATGCDRNSLRVRKEQVFQDWDVPAGPGLVGPKMLTLNKDGPAVDAGSILPNAVGKFAGKAPDLGCHEIGLPLPHYGARDEKARREHTAYWAMTLNP